MPPIYGSGGLSLAVEMSSLFSKALVYLGLVDEDGETESPFAGGPTEFEDEVVTRTPASAPIGRRVEPPSLVRGPTHQTDTRSSGVRTIRAPAQADILVIEEFTDARVLADRVRDRIPVVVDLRRADTELGRRVIDFSSGLIYALDGKMKKVGEALILVTPVGVEVTREEKRRLARLGAYEIEID